jgi:carbon monoxide dehydrogenase subunit G
MAMLHFEGDRDFPQRPVELWSKLSDARFLLECIPEVQAVSRSEPGMVVCKVRPGVSFVRGTLEVTIQVTETVEGASTHYLVHSKGIGSTSDVEATLTFTPHETGTRVHWAATVTQLGGLLKAVPQGLIHASAQKVIGDVWTMVETRLRSP